MFMQPTGNHTRMEITEGVYAFPQTIERETGSMTIYPAAVDTRSGLLLVDAGDPGNADQIAANLGRIGYDWGDVHSVLLTHQDGDHAGGVRDVLDHTDAIVYAHETAVPYIDGRKYPIKEAPGERYQPADVDVELVDGVTFRTDTGPMDVVFTPGHAPGHIALHLEVPGLLLVGDSITADDGELAPPWSDKTPDMETALDSMRRLADLTVERVLCYHGGLVEADGAAIASVIDSTR